MRYWNTGDKATDANLAHLEQLAGFWAGITVEHLTAKVAGATDIQRMLPHSCSGGGRC